MTTDVINGVPRELKPCPFCGGEAERFTLQGEENFGGDVIACKKCEACTRVVFGEKEGLIESWNRRTLLATAQPTADGEREAFEEWAASVGYHTERDMFQREKYQSSLTWELWRVWQARAAQPQQAVAVTDEVKLLKLLREWRDRIPDAPIYLRDLTDAQRLLAQLSKDLAQRDARIVQLEAEAIYTAAGVADDYKRIKALESQQAASVGGEREAFDQWFRRVKGLNDTVDTTFVSEAFFPYKAFKFGIEYTRTALSPEGGGVVYACPRCGTGMEVDTSAKPQANGQEADK